jgi:hypothetical protein
MVSVNEKETAMTAALILNIVFDIAVVAGIVGLLAWSIATQRRDRGVAALRRGRSGVAVPRRL